MHRFNGGYCYGGSYPDSNGYNTGTCLCRTICDTDSGWSKYLFLESVNGIKCNDGFKCDSKSIFNYHLHGYRRCIGMYSNGTSDSNYKSDSCCYRFSKHNHLHRTEYYSYGKRSEHLCMESINSVEYYHRTECYC